MPDRRLKQEEMAKFLEERRTGKLGFSGLEAFLEEKTEPSLHDLCLHELHGIAEALKQTIIQQGRDINTLKEKIKTLEESLKNSTISTIDSGVTNVGLLDRNGTQSLNEKITFPQ